MNVRILLFGFIIGSFMAVGLGGYLYKRTGGNFSKVEERLKPIGQAFKRRYFAPHKKVIEKFKSRMEVTSGKVFGKDSWLTFELFRQGTFVIDGMSGYAWQQSHSYRDSAFVRTSQALPPTYTIWAVVGGFDYGLEKIMGLPQDPEYADGPQNENGCYLLVITDELPQGHHTNTWWHQHRKIVIDIDNNAWGKGMPSPIFMVYFDRQNKLMAFDGRTNVWQNEWKKGISYEPEKWYKVEVKKTSGEFILSIYSEDGKLLKSGRTPLNKVWNADDRHPEYLVIGDPHENYYQGSMKIKEIGLSF